MNFISKNVEVLAVNLVDSATARTLIERSYPAVVDQDKAATSSTKSPQDQHEKL